MLFVSLIFDFNKPGNKKSGILCAVSSVPSLGKETRMITFACCPYGLSFQRVVFFSKGLRVKPCMLLFLKNTKKVCCEGKIKVCEAFLFSKTNKRYYRKELLVSLLRIEKKRRDTTCSFLLRETNKGYSKPSKNQRLGFF